MAPDQLRKCDRHIPEECYPEKGYKRLENKEWEEDVSCPVCMEFPHKAVLLLCSSHDMGCRPFMCGTSFRYSNCLDQYKKAYTKKVISYVEDTIPQSDSIFRLQKCEALELACPLCRGQVKGWTVVKPAREYLNSKKRSCMQDDCSFDGTYKELRKHMKAVHPSVTPREVDPVLEQKWIGLERDDLINRIRSTLSESLDLGDYVIEDINFEIGGGDRSGGSVDMDRNLINPFTLPLPFGAPGDEFSRHGTLPGRVSPNRSSGGPGDGSMGHISPVGGLASFDEDITHQHSHAGIEQVGGDVSLASRLGRQGQVILNRSSRRRGRQGEWWR